MKRKIIGLGKKSFVVSLPYRWIKDKGLEKKDEVEIMENGENLIIKPISKKTKQSLTLRIKESNKNSIKNFMIVLNSLGYDEVIIEYNNKELLQNIYEIASLNTGFALIEQTKEMVRFKTMIGEINEDIDVLFDRIFKINTSMAYGFLEAIKSKRYLDLKGLISLEKTNNQTTAYCQRLILKNGYKEQSKTSLAYMLAWNLETIADFYKLSCFLLQKKKKDFELLPKTVELIKKTNDLVEKLQENYRVMDSEKFHKIFIMKQNIGNEVEEIMKNGIFEDIAMGHYILDITTYIQDSATLCLGINAKETSS